MKALFTKKHFEAIADIIYDIKGIAPPGFQHDLATFVANKLQHTNVLFKRDMFLKACGVVADGSNNTSRRDQ